MWNITYTIFRNFLTERFTAVTVEVGNIIEEYYEENKRMRSVIQTSLDWRHKASKDRFVHFVFGKHLPYG